MQESTITEKVIALPLEVLDEPYYNSNDHPDQQVYELSLSLQKFGQRKTISVWSDDNTRYEVLAGNGIVKAARLAGFKTLDCTLAPTEWDIVYRKAFSVADNNRNSLVDQLKVAQILEEISADGRIALEALGSSRESLDNLLTDLANQALTPDVEFKEYDESIADEVEYNECPECGHKWPK